MLKDGSRNLTLRSRSDVALYILNHKRAQLSAMEQRFGVTLTILIDEHITARSSSPSRRASSCSAPSVRRGCAAPGRAC